MESCADPAIIYGPDTYWYMYCTTDPLNDEDRGAGGAFNFHLIPIVRSSDLVSWTYVGDAVSARPDWLAEPRGADVLPSMRWFPFVTFWQVSADMAFANGVPAGHGHNFGSLPVAAWARIAPPDGWTAERTTALTELMS